MRSYGSILNKQQVLRDLEEGGLTFPSITLCIEDFRVFETSAVIIGESHAIANRAGLITPMQFRLVAIYELLDTNLRLSYFQSTDRPTASRTGARNRWWSLVDDRQEATGSLTGSARGCWNV